MKIEEKKKRKTTNKLGFWGTVAQRRKDGKPRKKPGQKGYPSKETWKRFAGESATIEEQLRIIIKETIRDISSADFDNNGEYTGFTGFDSNLVAGRDAEIPDWVLEYVDELEEWPPGYEQYATNVKDETSGGADRPLSSVR
jgi:hypothetical protein